MAQGEETEFDLDAIKKDLYDVFDQWLISYQKEKKFNQNRITLIDNLVDEVIESNKTDNIQFIDFSSLPDFEEHAVNDNELMPQYMEYYHLRRFLYSFVDKAIAVDPLDRALWAEVDIVAEE